MPAEKGLYKVQVDNRNAFWSYEYLDDGCSVRTKWGRIGTDGQTQDKNFMSSFKRDQSIAKLIAEKKIGKGYKPETEEGLKKEEAVAEALGTQYKIQNLYYIQERIGNSFRIGKNYYPDEGIVVEVLQSWTKEVTWLFLTKKDSQTLEGVSKAGNGVSFTRSSICYKTNWVRAIRKFLKDTAEAVAKIITQQFGGVTRKLVLGDDSTEDDTQINEVIEAMQRQSVGGSGVGQQALLSFASLGARVLELD